MRMTVQVTYIFTQIVSLKDSFCHRGKSKLGIGLFIHELLREPLIPRAKIENEYFPYSRLWKPSDFHGVMFKAGESVLVTDDNDHDIVVKIGDFLCATVDDKFYSLLRGELYSAIENDEGMQEIYCYNAGILVVPSNRQVVFGTERILCKIMLYPDPEHLESPNHFITIDPMPFSYALLICRCGCSILSPV